MRHIRRIDQFILRSSESLSSVHIPHLRIQSFRRFVCRLSDRSANRSIQSQRLSFLHTHRNFFLRHDAHRISPSNPDRGDPDRFNSLERVLCVRFKTSSMQCWVSRRDPNQSLFRGVVSRRVARRTDLVQPSFWGKHGDVSIVTGARAPGHVSKRTRVCFESSSS